MNTQTHTLLRVLAFSVIKFNFVIVFNIELWTLTALLQKHDYNCIL